MPLFIVLVGESHEQLPRGLYTTLEAAHSVAQAIVDANDHEEATIACLTVDAPPEDMSIIRTYHGAWLQSFYRYPAMTDYGMPHAGS